MAGFARVKRVTDPLDDKVKARIVPDYLSSGSEHSAHAAEEDDDAVSPSLSDLVYGFLADDAATESPRDDSDSKRDLLVYDSHDSVEHLIKPLVQNNEDSFRNMLSANVMKAMEVFCCVNSNAQVLRRNVMAFLRNLGFNAAICKTKWESSGGLTAGNYEFIDVSRSDSLNRLTRYFIDIDFAKEFEIARPTSSYEHAVHSIPRVFVGKSEELKQILKVMSDAAKRSLKSRDLHLPPWRKHRYMQNKWLGPCKRTTNVFPAPGPVISKPADPLKQNFAVKCRSIGFDVTAMNGRFLFPAITRTR